MNKAETIQIITLLAGNYDSISKKDNIQKQLMINTWQECLGDLEYKVVLQAVKKTIISSQYIPTISEIRKNAMQIINRGNEYKTALDAWNEAYKMIKSGTYMTKEEFETHTEDVKKFFGSVDGLKAYSMNTDFNLDVVRSNFLKQYDTLIKRKEETQMLPKGMQEMITGVASKLELKVGEK